MTLHRGIVRLTEPARLCPECNGEVHTYSDEDEANIYRTFSWCSGCKKYFTYGEFCRLKHY